MSNYEWDSADLELMSEITRTVDHVLPSPPEGLFYRVEIYRHDNGDRVAIIDCESGDAHVYF